LEIYPSDLPTFNLMQTSVRFFRSSVFGVKSICLLEIKICFILISSKTWYLQLYWLREKIKDFRQFYQSIASFCKNSWNFDYSREF
jgi:hypothetical protein